MNHYLNSISSRLQSIKWRSLPSRYWTTAHPAEKAFITITLTFGLAFMIITPPLQAADENAHFYRAYQVSELHLVPDITSHRSGGYIPAGIINLTNGLAAKLPFHPDVKFNFLDLQHYVRQPLLADQPVFIPFEGTAIYPPVPYAPQALGILLGRILHLSPLLLMYVGRLFNLLAWIIVTGLAIRLLPFGKWALFALAVTPMMIFQASSLSADVFNIALIFLFVAYVLHIACRAPVVSQQTVILLAILSIALGCSKMPSFLITLSAFFIPVSKYKSSIYRLGTVGALFLLSLSFALIWYKLSAPSNLLYNLNITPAADPTAQLSNIIHYPTRYLYALYQTFMYRADVWLVQYAGFLGWLDTKLSYFGMIGTYILITLGLLYADPILDSVPSISRLQRWSSLGLFIVSSLAVITLLYAAWTPLKDNIIEGVQGRYFIPYSILLIPTLAYIPLKITAPPKNFAKTMSIMAGTILVLSIIFTLNRYYSTFDIFFKSALGHY